MAERQWKLGEDLLTGDNMLDSLTFDDLITAVRCDCQVINSSAVCSELAEMLTSRIEDMMELLERNMDAIIAEAGKGRES